MSEIIDDKNERIKQRKKEWALENKERIKQRKKEWYEKNKQRILQERNEKYKQDKEKIKQRVRKYNKSNGAIKKKIRRHFEEDEEKGRISDIDYDYIINLLQNQDYKCKRCNILVKLSWTDAYDNQQFSINRINNDLGHIKGNVEITCLSCNRIYHHS
jgi:rubrerythrin